MGLKLSRKCLTDYLYFDPVRFFVEEYFIYPDVVRFQANKVDSINLYNHLKDKFGDEFKDCVHLDYLKDKESISSFWFVHDERENSIIIHFDTDMLQLVSNEIDEGMISIIQSIIDSCYEKEAVD